jgi:hypothetical protein
MLREHVWNELTPRLPTEALSGSEKYELAAKIAEWQSMEPRHIADLLLRAAWCCVDESDIEAERYFRRKQRGCSNGRSTATMACSGRARRAHVSRR